MSRCDRRVRYALCELQRFVQFFLLVAFVVTCCMMLFLSTMGQAMNVAFTEADIQLAAKITLGNVFLLTFLLTLLDMAWRRHQVERPLRAITEAADRIIHGDFSVRIGALHAVNRMDVMQEVADCMDRMAEELSGMETLRGDFIANVSHELKTPMTVIRNYAQLLMAPGLSQEERLEYAGAIDDQAHRLSSLVSNILKLNKLENQQIFPRREAFDLGEQLCCCLLGFEAALEEKALDLRVEMEDDVTVEGDAELLSLVWNNLISNAVKFTPYGGTITLTMRTQDDLAVVTVADTGCGFGSEVGAHLFEKFYQGDASRATQGNGLGLALVRRVVDIVGGNIAVESEVGRGSAFTVQIRRKMDEMHQGAPVA